jgi:hypothetical protein
MRNLVLAISIIFVLMLVSPIVSQEKQVTLTGKITCAHCDLKLGKECATVIVVNENDKDVIYYLDAKSHRANHKTICDGAKEGSVTGTVTERDGKRIITVSKVEFKS